MNEKHSLILFNVYLSDTLMQGAGLFRKIYSKSNTPIWNPAIHFIYIKPLLRKQPLIVQSLSEAAQLVMGQVCPLGTNCQKR